MHLDKVTAAQKRADIAEQSAQEEHEGSTRRIAQLEEMLQQEQAARIRAEQEASMIHCGLQQTEARLAESEAAHRQLHEVNLALSREKEALNGRVASLEQFLTLRQGHDVQEKLGKLHQSHAQQHQNQQSRPRAAASSTPIGLDGSALRNRVAQRIERGDFIADYKDKEASVDDIKSSNYPVNFNSRLRQAEAEGVQGETQELTSNVRVPASQTATQPATEPINSNEGNDEADSDPPEVYISSLNRSSLLDNAEQRLKEREERLAKLTGSWDDEVRRGHLEDEDRRHQLHMATGVASLSKHMDAMQSMLQNAGSK